VRLTERDPELPQFLDEVVMTLLARDPDDRPRDGYEAYDLLRRVLDREGLAFPSIPPRSGSDGSVPTSQAGGQISTPPSSSSPEPAQRRPGPHLTTVAFDRIGPVCGAALSKLDGWAGDGPLTPAAESAIAQARKVVVMVLEIARIVGADGAALDALQARAREVRADLGRKLDDVARERSKHLGWAGTIAERSYLVASRRESGVHPLPVVDAMVWEQAALEHEEEKVRANADDLARQIDVLSAEIARQNERLEHEMLVLTAQLDGHIGALRSIALEAWIGLEDAARRLGRPPQMLVD
jgi:serine/threonine-protein kinase